MCYRGSVPTTQNRIAVTDTGHVATLLDQATTYFAEPNRAKALKALLEEGGRAIEEKERKRVAARHKALDVLIGSSRYPEGYREELLDEWPA